MEPTVPVPSAPSLLFFRETHLAGDRRSRRAFGFQISNKFVEAAQAYAEHPIALHLRAMNMLYEAIKEKGSMVIVPSSAVETMGLGGSLAVASLNNGSAPR